MLTLRIFTPYIILFILFTAVVFPQGSRTGKNVSELTEYIASSPAFDTKDSKSHIDLVDSIFLHALSISDGDISGALAACTWTCLTVRTATVISPLIGYPLVIPFFSASDSVFRDKNRRLPRYLFPDSPPSGSGDVDKLAHFFGTAYIEYNSFIAGVTYFFGVFIEVFEESFKVDSKFSVRDVNVNSLGIKFGDGLKKKSDLLPSQFLKQYKTHNEK